MLRIEKPYWQRLAVFGVLLAFLVAGCASGTTPAPAKTQAAAPTKAATAGWQAEWESTKTKAAAEGTLVIAASAGPAVRDPLTRYFKENQKLNLEWISGRSEEILQRVLTEQRSGIYNPDVYFSGAFIIPPLKAQSAILSLDPVLLLPEVLDKNAWWGGDLLFLDKQHTWVTVLAFPQPYILINTDLVKPGEVKGWKDLLDPKWKGKMVLYNPKTGAGIDWAVSVAEMVMSRDYLREFARQEPVILGDSRQQCEWVARGKYPIAVAPRTENMMEFKKLGSPVEIVSPVEGIHLTSGASGVSLFKNAPHPNAAKLFINWALTKEGGTLFSKLIGGQSARLDVPTDFLDPTMVRQPGQKYFNAITDDYIEKINAYPKVIDEIFGPLMK